MSEIKQIGFKSGRYFTVSSYKTLFLKHILYIWMLLTLMLSRIILFPLLDCELLTVYRRLTGSSLRP